MPTNFSSHRRPYLLRISCSPSLFRKKNCACCRVVVVTRHHIDVGSTSNIVLFFMRVFSCYGFRKVSNRESARRSRKRKQAHLADLEVKVHKSFTFFQIT